MSVSSIRNLDYVILLCDDLTSMSEFYRDVLGFKIDEADKADDWIQFRVGSGLLCLRPRGRWYDGPSDPAGASIQLSFRVSPNGVNNTYDELTDKNVEILEPPTDQDFGQRTLYFKDPENNVLEIYAEI